MRWASCVGFLVVVTLVGCGGSGGNSPSTPSGPTRTVLLQTTFALGNFNAARFDVKAPGTGSGSGTLEATANWSSASNNVDVVVTDGACVGLNVVGICSGRPCCTVLVSAESRTAKPEKATVAVPPGSYSVWVLSLGPGAESGTIEVTYTR